MNKLYKEKLKNDLNDLQTTLAEDVISIAELNFTLGRISLIRELIIEGEK